MPGRLEGKTIAILATDGFEQAELFTPLEALRREGARVEVVSPKEGAIQGFDHLTPDRTIDVDKLLKDARPDQYDALVLPGGANNPDQLRGDAKALDFVRAFFDEGKPVGAICHAPWILIDAGQAQGRTMTSWRTIRTDLENAGAHVVDEEVVVDHGLVTSRSPKDLPAFCAKLIEEFAEGRHRGQQHATGHAENRLH